MSENAEADAGGQNSSDVANLRTIDSPATYELAETVVLFSDVKSAFDTFELWFRKYLREDLAGEDLIVSQSLFRDGIMQFVE